MAALGWPDLSGKRAVVTRGRRGLGREMALAFAAAGADVGERSRNRDACEAVALTHALAPPARVNALVPGGFRTEISRHWSPERAQSLAAQRVSGGSENPRR